MLQAELHEKLKDSMVFVLGTGGSGKTTLVHEYAQHHHCETPELFEASITLILKPSKSLRHFLRL
jgi:ABC-type lipoprotein export system ATPase subunit